MFGLIRNIFGFILALALTLFAVFNRADVAVTFSPVNAPLNAPLYAVALGMFALGFILGAGAVWINTAPERKTRRDQKRKIRLLEQELSLSKTKGDTTKAPAPELFPALPRR